MSDTLLQAVRHGKVPAAVRAAAKAEGMPLATMLDSIKKGIIVVLRPHHPKARPCAIGAGTRVKVNANLGTSGDSASLAAERAKLRAALAAGADAVMDLSTGGNLRRIRRALRRAAPVAFGSVPIYDAAVQAVRRSGGIIALTGDDMLNAVREHCADGVDFVTVHCGLTRAAINRLKSQKRVLNVVSRGGSFLTSWMIHHNRENPLYERYDELLAILREFDVAISLGDGLRPGCLADASDRAQFEELVTLGELAARARQAGVQAFIEGPGHMPLNQIATNIHAQKLLCNGAPFYVLGPLVTDIAPGYDHITCAIGGAVAAQAGADFLCYVTPAEHLSLPDADDVYQGTIVCRIAAHAADIARGLPHAADRDLAMARARNRLDWPAQLKLAIDPALAKKYRARNRKKQEACSMCGDLCAIKEVRRHLRGR